MEKLLSKSLFLRKRELQRPFAIASNIIAAEAIFTIMGFPMTHLRQRAVALDKWKGLVVSHCLVILGLVFNTRKMTVGVTPEYRRKVLHLLDSHWIDREAFHIKEMEELVGKLGRIGQAYGPIYHLMPHMYASVAFALRDNEYFLASTSRNFRKMMKKAKQKKTAFTPECDLHEINFAIGQVARKVHQVKNEYRIPESLKEEIKNDAAHLA